jgi:GH15 family glucan-1,4-alpha-glucosidase
MSIPLPDQPSGGRSQFPPIGDYGFLSDCEKLLSYASPLQLYAEEIDPRTGRQLGNFPQAFTHLALITAVTAVIRAERAQPR